MKTESWLPQVTTKVLVVFSLLCLEGIVGLWTIASPKYAVAGVVSIIVMTVSMFVLKPNSIMRIIFIVSPLSILGIKIGADKNIHLVHVFTLSLLLSLMLRGIIRNKLFVRSAPMSHPIIILLLLSTISVAWAPTIGEFISSFLQIIFAVCLYFLIVNVIESREELYLCLTAFVIVILFMCGWQFIQALGLEKSGSVGRMGSYLRLGSLSASAATFGVDLLFAFWFSIALTGVVRSGLKKNIIYLCCMVIIVAIYLTKIKACYVAFSGSVLFFLALRIQPKNLLLYLILISLGAVLVVTGFGRGSHSLSIIWNAFNTSDLSMLFRYVVWDGAFRMIKDNFFVGVGLGGFGSSFSEYNRSPLSAKDVFENSVPCTHNLYLDVLTELGIIGFVLFALVIAGIMKNLIISLSKAEDSGDKNLAMSMLMAVVAVTIHGIAGSEKDEYTVWMMLGICSSVYRIIGPFSYNKGLSGVGADISKCPQNDSRVS